MEDRLRTLTLSAGYGTAVGGAELEEPSSSSTGDLTTDDNLAPRPRNASQFSDMQRSQDEAVTQESEEVGHRVAEDGLGTQGVAEAPWLQAPSGAPSGAPSDSTEVEHRSGGSGAPSDRSAPYRFVDLAESNGAGWAAVAALPQQQQRQAILEWCSSARTWMSSLIGDLHMRNLGLVLIFEQLRLQGEASNVYAELNRMLEQVWIRMGGVVGDHETTPLGEQLEEFLVWVESAVSHHPSPQELQQVMMYVEMVSGPMCAHARGIDEAMGSSGSDTPGNGSSTTGTGTGNGNGNGTGESTTGNGSCTPGNTQGAQHTGSNRTSTPGNGTSAMGPRDLGPGSETSTPGNGTSTPGNGISTSAMGPRTPRNGTLDTNGTSTGG